MPMLRLITAAALLTLLAACDDSPKPPAASAPAAEAPAAEAPAKTPAPAPSQPLLPASAEATAPLFGTWAADLAQCANPAATIAISVARYESAEAKCDITRLGDNGDGSYTATLACTGGTEQVAMTPLFTPTGEGIGIAWPDRDNKRTTVLRCQ
jgi:hypothetical protein